MALFSLSRGGVTMSTSADLITLIAAVNRKFKVVDMVFAGNGATSAAARARSPLTSCPTSMRAWINWSNFYMYGVAHNHHSLRFGPKRT